MRAGKFLAGCCLALIVTINLHAQSAPAVLTLKQCVETALKNNMDVKLADLNSQRDFISLRGAKGAMLPSLIGDVRHNLRQGRTIDYSNNSYTNTNNTAADISLSADVTLFNGFRLFNNLKARQYMFDAGRMEWQQARDMLTLNVILAYLDVLSFTDVLQQTEQLTEVTQKQVDRLAIMHEEGAIKPSDYFDLKGQLAANKLSLIDTRNQLNNARLRLAQLMNITYDESLTVERIGLEQFDMTYSTTPDAVYQSALEQLAQVKAVDLVKKSAEKDVKAARGGLFPTVSLGAGYNTSYQSIFVDTANKKIPYFDQLKNNRGTNVGVGVYIPFMSGFQNRNRLSLSKIALKEAEYYAENTRIQLRQNIERDHLNMTATLNRYQALVDQVGSYAENFRAAEVRFNNGASNSVDYLIAKNKLDNSKIDLIIARYDFLLRTRILDYYQGKLSW
ncbi:TolC family protein [Pseudobacter ginsenosidimutans]|uniref:Outer membrane protein n=1 Tax=Pseudobacter ginsenosidimutans TaxID=661488 RepID=A0A4Q7N5Z5_9BACT|nr:TolC family protein [Pseudobacter ginsenosidimutans]QEC44994.1 TolC family protein [Pseudobacter ginsenosidimutans]RZS76488.1 outer membrane protein [Pseudobacter ginsenosidimutans]